MDSRRRLQNRIGWLKLARNSAEGVLRLERVAGRLLVEWNFEIPTVLAWQD